MTNAEKVLTRPLKTVASAPVKTPAPPTSKTASKPALKTSSTNKPASSVKAALKTPSKPVATAAAPVPVKAAPQAPLKPKAAKPEKVKKPKLVRDSFTIPKAEYSVLDELKQRAGQLASPAKKSELLRAGIKALAAMTDVAFLNALKAVPVIKTGRPAKSKSA